MKSQANEHHIQKRKQPTGGLDNQPEAAHGTTKEDGARLTRSISSIRLSPATQQVRPPSGRPSAAYLADFTIDKPWSLGSLGLGLGLGSTANNAL